MGERELASPFAEADESCCGECVEVLSLSVEPRGGEPKRLLLGHLLGDSARRFPRPRAGGLPQDPFRTELLQESLVVPAGAA